MPSSIVLESSKETLNDASIYPNGFDEISWITGKKIIAETSETLNSEPQQIPRLPCQEVVCVSSLGFPPLYMNVCVHRNVWMHA